MTFEKTHSSASLEGGVAIRYSSSSKMYKI